MAVNNELRIKWKEMVAALSRHLLGVVEETDRVVSVGIGNRTGALLSYKPEACFVSQLAPSSYRKNRNSYRILARKYL
jgi:hypothetical protein